MPAPRSSTTSSGRPPPPLVPRHLRLEVDERILADGSVASPLDEASVLAAVTRAVEGGVTAVAICFLHAYRNAAHEQAAAAIVRRVAPGLYVSVSSSVLPELGEYERTSTTVINACHRPRSSDRYLGSLERQLNAPASTRRSSSCSRTAASWRSAAARDRPAAIVESGPAAGVVGAARLASALGVPDLITFDMGGTTTKASLIEDGRPTQTSEYEVGAGISMTGGLGRGRGYALRLPVLDIAEVGAGGGSIVRVAADGGVRIGPESAGAVPGPGGVRPRRRGGHRRRCDARPRLSQPDAHRRRRRSASTPGSRKAAIRRDVAAPLGVDVATAAHGVFLVADRDDGPGRQGCDDVPRSLAVRASASWPSGATDRSSRPAWRASSTFRG